MGDKIDPTKVVVHLNQPNGKRGDPASFKVLKGKQPYDAGTDVPAVRTCLHCHGRMAGARLEGARLRREPVRKNSKFATR